MSTKKTLALRDVLPLVEANKFEIDHAHITTGCIDGRGDTDAEDREKPVLAKPGGNAGGLMSAFAAINSLGINSENFSDRAFEAFLKAIGGVENFTFHTDDHAPEDQPGMGCGHLANCRANPESYGLHQDQIEYIFGKFSEILERGGQQRVRVGNHGEQAVFLVDSDSFSIRPFFKTDQEEVQVFVYHRFLDSYRLDKIGAELFAEFSSDNPGLSVQDCIQAVKVAAQKQFAVTANKIATGLPIYAIRINDEGEISIFQELD